MRAQSNPLEIEKYIVRQILLRLNAVDVRFVFWDGQEIGISERHPAAIMVIHERKALYQMLLDPDFYIPESYATGRIDVRGNLVTLIEAMDRTRPAHVQEPWYTKLVARWRQGGRNKTLHDSQRNIHHHYDLNNDFYRLWLDRQMVYTCGYFPLPNINLEEAQTAKMDYVCRKLDLHAGEQVIEAGCGWGALALHMARNYGVTVRAYNISHEQVTYARARGRAEGLDGSVEFVEDDYRNIRGTCKAFVSVGMLEHVGLHNYETLGEVIGRCLEPDGRGFLHFIGRTRPLPLNRWITTRIFPGAYPPSLREAFTILESQGFAVLDVENLRLHYARTLEHWLERFEDAAARVSEMFGPEFVRVWRLYLAGSLCGFRTGWLHLFQVLFTHAGNNRIAWTRDHLSNGALKSQQEEQWSAAMS